MAMWGADVVQLKDLGSKLQSGAAQIEEQRTLLNKVLNSTDWKGPDADAFRTEWTGQHMAQLNKIAEALKDAGQKATRNANEQENASR